MAWSKVRNPEAVCHVDMQSRKMDVGILQSTPSMITSDDMTIEANLMILKSSAARNLGSIANDTEISIRCLADIE